MLLYTVDNLRNPTVSGLIEDTNNNPFDLSVEEAGSGEESSFGYIFRTQINLPVDGVYEFTTTSVEASTLSVDGVRIVDNEGLHALREIGDTQSYVAGFYDLEVRYLYGAGPNPEPA